MLSLKKVVVLKHTHTHTESVFSHHWGSIHNSRVGRRKIWKEGIRDILRVFFPHHLLDRKLNEKMMEFLQVPSPTSLCVLSIMCISSAQCKHHYSCCCQVRQNYLAFQEITSTRQMFGGPSHFVIRIPRSCRSMSLSISMVFAKHPTSGGLTS